MNTTKIEKIIKKIFKCKLHKMYHRVDCDKHGDTTNVFVLYIQNVDGFDYQTKIEIDIFQDKIVRGEACIVTPAIYIGKEDLKTIQLALNRGTGVCAEIVDEIAKKLRGE